MRQHLNKLALIVVLGSGFAIAQSMPQQHADITRQYIAEFYSSSLQRLLTRASSRECAGTTAQH